MSFPQQGERMMDTPPRPEFGRRRASSPSNGKPAPRSAGTSALAKWFASEPPDMAGPDGVVPTKLWAILQAAVGLLIVQLLLGFLFMAPEMAALKRGSPPVGSNTFFGFFLPLLLALGWNAAHFAAIYSMLAHATLRWIGSSSPQAYALGGLGAGWVLLAANALFGAHLTWSEATIELAGGLTAGYLYRLTAGKAPSEQA
jgi:hypothetical protein